eukprot:TRINITY_DN25981_c0_g1_i1.p1 TRINITY_DN25981_c0_g1~~TRINITY_DN25981_c0_g1_i1.p1  ORF type:complete len:565 (+),score=158.99 TRINITY_DN25981_c0_g1_i1:73-1767(+)
MGCGASAAQAYHIEEPQQAPPQPQQQQALQHGSSSSPSRPAKAVAGRGAAAAAPPAVPEGYPVPEGYAWGQGEQATPAQASKAQMQQQQRQSLQQRAYSQMSFGDPPDLPDLMPLHKKEQAASGNFTSGGSTGSRLAIGADGLPADVVRLELRTLEQLEMIDETPMSLVMKLRDRKAGRIMVGKRVRKGAMVHADGGHLNEVRMLRKLAGSAGIVGLLGICDNTIDFWTVLEWCGGGRLEVWLSKYPKSARNVAKQTMEAVQHLHGLLICHLDIKPDNVLVTERGQAKLCDFVTACQLHSAEQHLTGNCGTDGFRAPEVSATSRGYSGLLADAFSLGRTLQVFCRTDRSWRDVIRVAQDLSDPEPPRRPTLAAAHARLFGGQPHPQASLPVAVSSFADGDAAEGEVAFDFAALEAVSSVEAATSAQGAAAKTYGGGAYAHVPPDTRGRRRQQADAPPLQKQGPPQQRVPSQQPGRPPASKAAAAAPKAATAVKATPTAAIAPLDASVSAMIEGLKGKKPTCGRASCESCGVCLCLTPQQAAAGLHRAAGRSAAARGGMRRCTTP